MLKIIFISNLFFINLFSPLLFSQDDNKDEIFPYYVYTSDYSLVPRFEKREVQSIYVGENTKFENFFKEYDILDFFQAFPTSPMERDLNVFILRTLDDNFIQVLLSTFPDIFVGFDQIPPIELTYYVDSYYPNDYGATSPNSNFGVFERKDLDFINAHKAWGLTTGLNFSIGISDARINPTDPEFLNKLSFINPGSYQNSAYNPNNIETYHGTNVAGIAAAQGDNYYGTVGVCYDCSIVMTAYGIYNNLLVLAQNGIKVINMSWASYTPIPAEQNLINTIVEKYNVVLVASAGNRISYQTNNDFWHTVWNANTNLYEPAYTGMQIGYPASYDNVISVSSISHFYEVDDPEAFNSTSPLGFDIGEHIRNSFSPNVNIDDFNNPIGLRFNGWNRVKEKPNGGGSQIISPNGITLTTTMNEHVDILAPSGKIMNYMKFSEENIVEYYPGGSGSSSSSPYVSGTVALMLSLNDCLIPIDIDTILKITTDDIENQSLNQDFFGMIGAGKLNTGSAVTFVDEMKKPFGNALIQNHIFNRFSFNLSKFNNLLTISNTTFKEDANVDFTSRNGIFITNGSHFNPSGNAFVNLKVDNSLDICPPPPQISKMDKISSNLQKSLNSNDLNKSIIFPNPNFGAFKILIKTKDSKEEVLISFYDINGNLIRSNLVTVNNLININVFDFSLIDLSSGIYLVKILSKDKTETLKLIIN